MNTLKRRASRISGFESIKVKFTIAILSATFGVDAVDIPSGSEVSVCFERGGKISSTSDYIIDEEQQTEATDPTMEYFHYVEINEKVELIATLYKEMKTGKYQEKIGKLYLRRKARKGGGSLFSSESYVGLGMCQLNLDQLTDDLAFETSMSKEVVLGLDPLKGGKVHIIIHTSLVKFANDDDSMSISSLFSDTSDVSTIGAKFNRNNSSQIIQNPLASSVSYDRMEASGTSNSNSPVIDVEARRELRRKAREIRDPALSETLQREIQKRDALIEVLERTVADLTALSESQKVQMARLGSSLLAMQEKDALGIEQPREDGVDAENEFTSNMEKTGANKDTAVATISSATTVTRAGAGAGQSSVIGSDKKEAIGGDHGGCDVEDDQKQDAPRLTAENLSKVMPISKTAVVPVSAAAPVSVTATVTADAVSATPAVSSVLTDMAQDLQKERRATREAATAVMNANMKRAELQAESDKYLMELIDTKVKCANLSLDLDEERKKMRQLKSKLQNYAELINNMEIKYCSVFIGAGNASDNAALASNAEVMGLKSGSAVFSFSPSSIPMSSSSSSSPIPSIDPAVDSRELRAEKVLMNENNQNSSSDGMTSTGGSGGGGSDTLAADLFGTPLSKPLKQQQQQEKQRESSVPSTPPVSRTCTIDDVEGNAQQQQQLRRPSFSASDLQAAATKAKLKRAESGAAVVSSSSSSCGPAAADNNDHNDKNNLPPPQRRPSFSVGDLQAAAVKAKSKSRKISVVRSTVDDAGAKPPPVLNLASMVAAKALAKKESRDQSVSIDDMVNKKKLHSAARGRGGGGTQMDMAAMVAAKAKAKQEAREKAEQQDDKVLTVEESLAVSKNAAAAAGDDGSSSAEGVLVAGEDYSVGSSARAAARKEEKEKAERGEGSAPSAEEYVATVRKDTDSRINALMNSDLPMAVKAAAIAAAKQEFIDVARSEGIEVLSLSEQFELQKKKAQEEIERARLEQEKEDEEMRQKLMETLQREEEERANRIKIAKLRSQDAAEANLRNSRRKHRSTGGTGGTSAASASDAEGDGYSSCGSLVSGDVSESESDTEGGGGGDADGGDGTPKRRLKRSNSIKDRIAAIERATSPAQGKPAGVEGKYPAGTSKLLQQSLSPHAASSKF